MTLPQVKELLDYWEKHPPVHLLLAASLGYKPKPRVEKSDIGGLLGRAAKGVCRMEDLRGMR